MSSPIIYLITCVDIAFYEQDEIRHYEQDEKRAGRTYGSDVSFNLARSFTTVPSRSAMATCFTAPTTSAGTLQCGNGVFVQCGNSEGKLFRRRFRVPVIVFERQTQIAVELGFPLQP